MRKLNKKEYSRSDFGMRMRHMAKSKRSAELAIGTLVIIVLAIIVLVVVALGFGMGWSNLWSKMTGYFGGETNVDSIKQSCTYACTTQASFDYCCKVNDVKFSKDNEKRLTCAGGANEIGLGACGAILCSAISCDSVKCVGGTTALKGACGATNKEEESLTLDSTGKPIAKGNVCCIPLKTCVELGGVWKVKANNICPVDIGRIGTDITSQVTNVADKTGNTDNLCCKYT